MLRILWFSPKKVLWNVKKLELYHDCVIIFVLFLAVQNGEQKEDILCLRVLFIP
jgi:hypothetical protein